MRPALAAALVLVCSAATACGDAQGEDPAADPEVRAAGSQVRLVPEERANVVLHVSNQSFDDPEVLLTVAVDGVTVVDGDFHVEGQHNWITFPLRVSPGVHEVSAESDTGATLSESLRVPTGQRRWAVIDHWGEEGAAELTWLAQRRPLAFG